MVLLPQQFLPTTSDSWVIPWMLLQKHTLMYVLSQDADSLRFWEANSSDTVLHPLLPSVASLAAVPATKAICERLFKAGGQVLTSAMSGFGCCVQEWNPS